MARIHPLAHVDPKAELADDVEVGPFCHLGPEVRLGPRCRLLSHVCVTGNTTVGAGNTFYPFCCIGAEPQDLSYGGEPARVVIGDDNVLRESVTVHRGTAKDRLLTVVGSRNLIMAGCHIAHDCVLEDDIVMANNVLLGGHVLVERYATLGGACALHPLVTVGRIAFLGGMTRVTKDVPPFMTVEGIPPKVWMVNKIGCRRRGVSPEALTQLREAHRLLFRREEIWDEVLPELAARPDATDELLYLVGFCRRAGAGVMGRAREGLRRNRAAAEDEADS